MQWLSGAGGRKAVNLQSDEHLHLLPERQARAGGSVTRS